MGRRISLGGGVRSILLLLHWMLKSSSRLADKRDSGTFIRSKEVGMLDGVGPCLLSTSGTNDSHDENDNGVNHDCAN